MSVYPSRRSVARFENVHCPWRSSPPGSSGRGIEQQARAPFCARAQRCFGSQAACNFPSQFGCSLVPPGTSSLSACFLEIAVATLNFRQHLIEPIDQYADFIVRSSRCSDGIIFCRGHRSGGLREQQNGIWKWPVACARPKRKRRSRG